VSEEKPKPAAAPVPPPKLDRVPEGYKPPAVRPSVPATPPPPAAAPQPKRADAPGQAGARPPPPRVTPAGGSYGLAEREIGADAAIAAGLAKQGELGGDTTTFALFALAAGMQSTGRLVLSQRGDTRPGEPAATGPRAPPPPPLAPAQPPPAAPALAPPSDGVSFALSFRRGTVEHAASSDPEDALAAFLLRRGSLTAEGLARATQASAALGGDLVSALIAEKLVNPADVAALLQEHGAQLVQKALATEAGPWAWHPQAPPPPGAFPLGAPFGMLCAAVRALDVAAVKRRLGEREERAASRVGARIRVEDLRLTPQETRAAALFDGTRSPAELAAAHPGDALVVLRLAVLLGDLQLLAFGASRKGAAPPPPVAAPPPAVASGEKPTVTVAPPGAPSAPSAPPRPAAAPHAPRPAAPPAARPAPTPAIPSPTPAIPSAPAARHPAPAAPAKAASTPVAAPKAGALDRAALQALFAKLKDQDHFAVLGVKQDAAAAQLKIAYFQLAKIYHPDAVPTDAPEDVKKLAADVFAKVSEAWSVLGSDASRAKYVEELKSGGAADIDVMAIFEAERLFQEGTLLVKARKYDEGLHKFDEALHLNKDEAEFGMWKAWCEFILAEDKRKRFVLASSAIEAELRRNPRCAQGYLFLGQMAKIVGDLAAAEKHLRRGLAVAPEHTDLQRELKYLRK
jgi:hypothetical protein